MNLTKKRKKKGFTLIELMAVIAIIAILAAVLVPTVSGYIQRAKKTAIITQVRNVVSAIETHNATAGADDQITLTVQGGPAEDPTTTNVTLADVKSIVGSDLLSDDAVNKLDNELTVAAMQDINKDTNAIKNIKIDKDGKIIEYTSSSIGASWTK